MTVNFRMVVFWTTILISMSTSTAFFWGRSDPEPAEPASPWPIYYQQRLLNPHQIYTGNEPPIPMPAIPINVPLQAQLAAMPNIHNVQLVPCLCPVSSEDTTKSTDSTRKDV